MFNNSFFIQNTNGFTDWGLLSPHSVNAQEGPVNIKRAHQLMYVPLFYGLHGLRRLHA